MSTIIEHLAHGERVTHVVRWTPDEQAKHPCLSIEFRWTGEMTVTLKDGQFEVDSEQDIAKLCTVLTVIYRRARQHILEG